MSDEREKTDTPERGEERPETGEEASPETDPEPAPGIEHEPEPDAGNLVPKKEGPGTL